MTVKSEILDQTISAMRKFMDAMPLHAGRILDKTVWSQASGPNIVIGNDVGMELGSPKTESFAGLVWTNQRELIPQDKIIRIGPDIGESSKKEIPYGKVVMVAVDDVDKENAYAGYRMMDEVRYKIHLEGFMMRASSQNQREWFRVSKDALGKGFSLDIVGSRMIQGLKELPFVHNAEIVFITVDNERVSQVREICRPVFRVVSAMHKMVNEMEPDCNECDYTDVCSSANAMKSEKRRMKA